MNVHLSFKLLLGVCALILLTESAFIAEATADKLSVKLSSVVAGAPAKASFKISASVSKVNENIAVDSTSLYLPRGVILSAEKVSRCKKSTDEIQGGATCPKRSRLARGTIDLKTDYSAIPEVTADVEIFSGMDISKLMLVATEWQTQMVIAVEGKIDSTKSGYGLFFNNIPFEPLGPGTGVHVYLEEIDMEMSAKGVYRNPLKCSGSWRFSAKLHYQQGGNGKSVSKVPCRK